LSLTDLHDMSVTVFSEVATGVFVVLSTEYHTDLHLGTLTTPARTLVRQSFTVHIICRPMFLHPFEHSQCKLSSSFMFHVSKVL